MAKKPTYEELEQRVKALEKETLEGNQALKRLNLISRAVEQSSEGVAVTDLKGNLLYLNDTFAKMHGYSPEEIVGKNLSIFHTPEQMPSVEKANRYLKETGRFSGEIWHLRRDGTVFPALMNNSILRDDTAMPIGMIGTVRDITERKR
ncbi:MAG: PAS domain S-box protein, partial [Desulfobacteraceae bacterium]|nr:PAS domain S-box protein [Desulfobacteraceae bacterium]